EFSASPPVEAAAAEAAPSWLDEPPPNARQLPLRFMWQMDCEGRFSLGSDEFTRLIGTRTAAGFGRPWSEIAETFGLDPEGLVAPSGPAAELPTARHTPSSVAPELPNPIVIETSRQSDLETAVETTQEDTNETPNETSGNVLPFRPLGEPKSPVLTPVENSAF